MALINYSNVNIYQDTQMVLKGVNFTVGEGEFIYVTGKVGSGKSTLIKTLYAELPVEGGEATVLGHDLLKMKQKNIPELRRKLGIIFQDFQLLTDRTVEANLRFVLKATGWKDKREMDQRIKDVLELVGMSTKGYKMPNELSGGEQQRISIARAILNKPQIILADEPTGNLDVETSNNITQLLQDISKGGSTVIMITHNMNLLSRFPGKVYRCEDHEFTEITTPVFDLSSFDDDSIFGNPNEEIAISTVAEGTEKDVVKPAGQAKKAEEAPAAEPVAAPVETAVLESQSAPIEAAPAEAAHVEPAHVEAEPVRVAAPAPQEEETKPVMSEMPELQPIDLDGYQPSDITTINDIIRTHEQGKTDEVVD